MQRAIGRIEVPPAGPSNSIPGQPHHRAHNVRVATSLGSLVSLLLMAGIGLWPNESLAQCAKPVPLQSLGKEIEAARQAYFLAEFWQALDRLKAAEEQLGCLNAVVSPEDLRALYSLKGTVHINVEQAEDARRSLNRAAAVSSTTEWDQELGNRGKTLFLDVKATQLTHEPGPLLLSFKGAVGYEIAVDGKQLATGTTLDGLYPGEHFLQYRKDKGGWEGRWVSFLGAPPWIPELTETGEVTVQRAAGKSKPTFMSRVHWKPGLYIAGGTGALALGAGVVSLVASSQASTILDNLSDTETLPDSYDTYATRANVSAIVAASSAGAAVISAGLAFLLPAPHDATAQLYVSPRVDERGSGAVLALQWKW